MEELTYGEFSSAIKNLVINTLEIYNLTFNKIMPLEQSNPNDQELDNYINKLKYLKKKEKNILNYIYDNDCQYDEDVLLNECLLEYIDDDNIRSLIYVRLDNLFMEKNEEFLKNNTSYDEDEENEYEYDEESECFEKIFNYLNIEYLAHMTEKDKEITESKYKFSFTNTHIEDELMFTRFNTENLIVLPKEINAHIMGIDMENYEQYENEVCMECILNIINQIEDGVETNEKSNIDVINFFASKLEYYDLKDLKDVCLYKKDQIFDGQAKEFLFKLIDIFNNYLKTANKDEQELITIDEIEENEEIVALKEKEVDIIFELIKTENKIYNLVNGLYVYELEKKNDIQLYKKIIKAIKRLKNKESYLKSFLVVDKNTKDILKDLIDNCLNIFEDNNMENYENIFKDSKGKSKIIKTRILNLLKESKSSKISLYIDENLPTIIENEQYLEAFKKYNKYIKIKKNIIPWLQVKYQKIFEDDFLLTEFLENEGDLSKNTWYSEEILCNLLEITKEEYQGDKNQILFDLAENVIVDIYIYATKEKLTPKEVAESKFNLFLLKEITENLDKEMVEMLEKDSQYTEENYKFNEELTKIFTKSKDKTANKK